MRHRPRTLAAARRRLRLMFGAAFLLLALPTVALVIQAHRQLELDAFRRLQLEAEQFVTAVDASLAGLVAEVETYAAADFDFLVVVSDDGVLERSALAAYPVPATIPGLLGFFQVDADGSLTTPLMPPDGVHASDWGVSGTELAARRALADELRTVLAENRIVGGIEPASAPVEAAESGARGVGAAAEEEQSLERVAGQAVFDQLTESAVPASARAPRAQVAVRPELDATARDAGRARAERAFVLEDEATAAPSEDAVTDDAAEVRIDVFTSELEPFAFSMLDTGHFVLFRDAWRDGSRFVQGALVEQAAFIETLLGAPLVARGLREHAGLTLSYGGAALLGASANGETLLRARLSPPFAELELSLVASSLPSGPGRALLVWLTIVLAVVLPAVFLLAYRFSWRQLALARQQQDFVAAVSHELKTPLTSIRMYGEMLKAGWADDAKRRAYYEYIYDESERLSRLIENVLQLARITRHGPELATRPHTVAELLDLVASKVKTRIEQAGFTLRVSRDERLARDTRIEVDADRFVQIAINLVDNAVKFSADAEERVINVGIRPERDARVAFTVRDFGPGVPRKTMRKLFELFYRPDNALTRATAGTGIGLALVKQLAEAMDGKVDVRNAEPGAEFVVSFPIAAPAA